MSLISTAFVTQFGANIRLLVQQKGSRLESTVTVESGVTGEYVMMEQIAAATASKRTQRHADTPVSDPDPRRRRITLFDYEHAVLLDDADKLKTLIDPTSTYAINGAYALGRAKDDEIITAADATAYTGVDGSTTVAFPTSTNQIAAGGTGLSVAKLLQAKEILDAAETDPDEERFCVVTAAEVTDLLNTTEVRSSDYNSVKSLVEGKIDTFCGFKFKRTQRLGTSSGSNKVLAYVKSGIGLAVAQDIKTRIGERADKSYSTQVYVSLGLGASRLEEEKVVVILCA